MLSVVRRPKREMALTSPQPEMEPAAHKSLALSALVQQMQSDRKYEILDLGPALGVNIGFWSQFQSRLYVADFYRSLGSSDSLQLQEGIPYESVFRALLTGAADARFDIILAWDIFNYLNHDLLEGFIHYLGKLCRPGAFLFALISIMQQIPSDPIIFRILDREQLLYESRSAQVRPCPRHQAREINRMMAGFRVFGSFILRHGVQEYLFVRE